MGEENPTISSDSSSVRNCRTRTARQRNNAHNGVRRYRLINTQKMRINDIDAVRGVANIESVISNWRKSASLKGPDPGTIIRSRK